MRAGRAIARRTGRRRSFLPFALPCMVAFVLIPDLIMLALFGRGAFTAEDAALAGSILAAYAVALPAVVLIRSALASFYARSDTVTPLKISLTAVAVNIAFKLVLTGPFGVVGLALATAIGAWVNLGLLMIVARRRSWSAPDVYLGKVLAAALAGCMLLAAFVLLARTPPCRYHLDPARRDAGRGAARHSGDRAADCSTASPFW